MRAFEGILGAIRAEANDEGIEWAGTPRVVSSTFSAEVAAQTFAREHGVLTPDAVLSGAPSPVCDHG